MSWLDSAADIATVITALVAVGAYGWYQLDFVLKRRRLEAFLKGEKSGQRSKTDSGSHTLIFLGSQLRMTEAEVMEAGFRSKKIKCRPRYDKLTGFADVILFEYDHEKFD